jgi:hypothetical protein
VSFHDESADAPLSNTSHDATLLLLSLIADARDQLATTKDPAEQLEILRDFVEVARPETTLVSSCVSELFTLLSVAVAEVRRGT